MNQVIDDASARVGDALTELHEAGELPDKAPVPGSQLSIDSTDVPAYGNPRREKLADLNARWGHRTPKSNMDAAGEMFYGYKVHAICDAYYGTPLAWSFLPANANDSPQLLPLVDHVLDQLPDRTVRYLMADRGYDGMPNYQYLDDNKVLAVIHIKDTDKGSIYDLKGRPLCLGKRPMRYVRTDRGKGHLFRCDPTDDDGHCPLLTASPWLGARCNGEHYETWKGDLLRRVGRLPRASKRWARLYKRRTTVERMFSSMKRSRLLAQHSYLGIGKVRLHASMSVLTYAGTMLARVLAGNWRAMRRMKLRQPSTWAVAA